MPQEKEGKLLLIDPEECDAILRSCASAMAFDINTEMIWKEYGGFGTMAGFANLVANTARIVPVIGQVIGGISYRMHGQYWSEAAGGEEVDFNSPKFRTDRDSFYQMFCQAMVQNLVQGPQQSTTYLQSRLDYTKRSWANIRYKFQAAAKVNDEVIRELDIGLRRLDTVQVLAAATFSTALSFMPGGILVLTAVGASYPLACKLVTTLAGVPEVNAVGYVKKQARDAGAGALTNAGQDAIKFGLRNTLLENAAKDAENTVKNRLEAFTRQSGQELSRAQRRSVGRAVQGFQEAEMRAAQSASRAHYFAGGVGAAVGLLFMKDDLLRAYANMKAEFGD